ncbi:MAG: hypothetical protein HY275_15840 [Gemmatimonadetes bacterium]|nr:hypothetical protein [Gemmatimonadota bacterium]
MTAVAVWPVMPDADALLHDRLARGWKPTPTRLKEGERVLGHAACVVAATHRVTPT